MIIPAEEIMKIAVLFLVSLIGLLSDFTSGLASSDTHSRRNFLASIASSGVLLGVGNVAEAEEDPEIDVYFGCGCFW